MAVVLETERLVLRRFTESDVDRLVRLDGDPAVMRYLTGGEATPRAEIEQILLPRLLDEYSRGPRGRWAAEARDTGEFLGWLSLAPVADPGEAALGYRFGSAHWGRGFATEGGVAVGRARPGVREASRDGSFVSRGCTTSGCCRRCRRA